MTRMIAALLMSLALMLTGTVTSAVADETEEMGDTRAGHVYLNAVCPANSATDRFYRVIWGDRQGDLVRGNSPAPSGAPLSRLREPWAWQKRERRGSCSTLRRYGPATWIRSSRRLQRIILPFRTGFSPWGLLTRPSDHCSAVGAAREFVTHPPPWLRSWCAWVCLRTVAAAHGPRPGYRLTGAVYPMSARMPFGSQHWPGSISGAECIDLDSALSRPAGATPVRSSVWADDRASPTSGGMG